MPKSPRSYASGCLAAHALDHVGDRWSLLIVRELMLGPQRFGAIRTQLPGIATNMLTDRLAALEAAGVLVHEATPPPAAVPVYRLTAAGHGLWPVIEALCHWAVTMPGHDPRLPISPSALMLSMKAMGRIGAFARHKAGFVLDGQGFAIAIAGGSYDVRREDAPAGDFVIAGTSNAAAAAVYGPQPLAASAASGLVTVSGDPARAQRFIDLFSLQPKGGSS